MYNDNIKIIVLKETIIKHNNYFYNKLKCFKFHVLKNFLNFCIIIGVVQLRIMLILQ